MDSTLSYRFWSKVEERGGDQCWMWLASHFKNGYGQFWLNNTPVYAHRIAYILTNGEVPDGKEIHHTCRHKGCVNPNHLKAVTHAENVQASVLDADGNGPKFSMIDVDTINELKYEISSPQIAEIFDCSPTTVRQIWNGTHYTN